jgi:hypothetical protein
MPYDALNLLTQVLDPLTRSESYQFMGPGLLILISILLFAHSCTGLDRQFFSGSLRCRFLALP